MIAMSRNEISEVFAKNKNSFPEELLQALGVKSELATEDAISTALMMAVIGGDDTVLDESVRANLLAFRDEFLSQEVIPKTNAELVQQIANGWEHFQKLDKVPMQQWVDSAASMGLSKLIAYVARDRKLNFAMDEKSGLSAVHLAKQNKQLATLEVLAQLGAQMQQVEGVISAADPKTIKQLPMTALHSDSGYSAAFSFSRSKTPASLVSPRCGVDMSSTNPHRLPGVGMTTTE